MPRKWNLISFSRILVTCVSLRGTTCPHRLLGLWIPIGGWQQGECSHVEPGRCTLSTCRSGLTFQVSRSAWWAVVVCGGFSCCLCTPRGRFHALFCSIRPRSTCPQHVFLCYIFSFQTSTHRSPRCVMARRSFCLLRCWGCLLPYNVGGTGRGIAQSSHLSTGS